MSNETPPPGIVLTDAPAAPLSRRPRGSCPACGAGKDQLMLVSPYRPSGPKVCLQCGHETAGEGK